MKYWRTTCLLLVCLSSNSFSQPKTLEANLSRATEAIDERYTELTKKQNVIGASIAIIDHGEIVYAKGFGYEDLKNNKETTPNTIYRIGSSTKSFTALAVMQLHEKGLININESIKKYIPELQMDLSLENKNDLCIKDILSHIAGLPNEIYNGRMGNNTPDIKWVINELNKQATTSQRSFTWAYSNIGFALLGELIHRVSGLSYEDYLQQYIFTPLDMQSSTIGLTEKLSKAYKEEKEFEPRAIRDRAAGSMTSTVLDMANFVNMLLQRGRLNNETFISSTRLKEMERNQLSENILPSTRQYGYGMTINTIRITDKNESRDVKMIGHGGDTEAFHGDYKYIPELQVGAIILTNTDKGVKLRNVRKLLKLYLKEAKGIDSELKFTPYIGKEIYPSNREIIGLYNFGNTLMEVKNVSKIKFELEGTKMILKQKDKQHAYSFKVLLWGFIPIKMEDTEFQFLKINDNIYIKTKDLDNSSFEFVAVKQTPGKISKKWESMFGDYQIINLIKPGGNFVNTSASIYEEKGILVLKFKAPEGEDAYFLNIISDKKARIGGVGTAKGDTVSILENGNIYFSGFEFKKQ